MSTCEDCIYRPKCISFIVHGMGDNEINGGLLTDIDKRCKGFKNKADFVSQKAYEQVKWERDTAIEQLKSYGVDFCENADVVKVKQGKWEKKTVIIFDSEKVGYKCSECNTTWDTSTNYCPYCGAYMKE